MKFRQVHLDFHTSEAIGKIGEKFNKEEFQKALKIGRVDSITLFSKCHHGWAYHPSEANEIHPGLKFDLLKEQIDASHEIGVKTPVYLSVGFDEKIVRKHPEWRFENKNHEFDNFSKAGYHLLCLNTPYLDYMLAQIKEAAEKYDADGIFLDIVGVRHCCCNYCVKDMLAKGLNPNDEKDISIHAEAVYANYLKRVRETIDSVKPGLPVFHNGGHIRHGRRDLAFANSHLELESLPTGGWGYDHFPISAKYAQNLGMEYMGMTGKFHLSWGEFGGFKHPNALRYETALNVACGAKCSIGDQLSPTGEIDMTTYELIGEAYKEIEEKEKWLDDVTPICDVAVLTVESSMNDFDEEPEENVQKADVGVGRILLEGKYLFSMIDSQTNFEQFKVIILPDEIRLKESTLEKLKAFVKNGGKILASGKSGIENGDFLFDFGAIYKGVNEYCPSYARPLNANRHKSDYIMYTECQKVSLTDGKELVQVIEPYFNRTAEHFCSHFHTPSSGVYGGAGVVQGKDGIYIAWNIFNDYAEHGELIAKRIVCMALDVLLGDDKSLKTSLGSIGITNLMKQDNRYIAHLLYASPVSRGKDLDVIEDIYPVYNIELEVKLPEKVKKAYLAPQNKELIITEENGYTKVCVDKIDCHQMVVFDI